MKILLFMLACVIFPGDGPVVDNEPDVDAEQAVVQPIVPTGANPEIEVLFPWQNGFYPGFFIVQTKNVFYAPELATNPVTQFAIGVDLLGDKLRFGEGHIHGWVFRVDRHGRLVRNDAGVPTPASYLRFYGAGGAEFFGDENVGYYFKTDTLPRGRYRAFFQLQQNDHTGMLQASAPAFPGITSVDFRQW